MQYGYTVILVALTLAHELDVASMLMVDGNIIFILPLLDILSDVTILNVYEVFAFTYREDTDTVEVSEPGCATIVVVPCIFIYPLRYILTMKLPVG